MERLRKEDEEALIALEEKHRGKLTFVSNSSLHLEEFTVSHAETGVELFSNAEK